MKFQIVVRRIANGLFIASCAELSGCHVEGRSEAEARALLKAAIAAYVKSCQIRNEKIPVRTAY